MDGDDYSSLRIRVEAKEETVLVELAGALDETTVAGLRRIIADLPLPPGAMLVFDMSGVPFVDNEGFGALINIQKRMTETGRSLVLVGCREAVRLALALTRLEVLFPHYPSVQQVPRHRR